MKYLLGLISCILLLLSCVQDKAERSIYDLRYGLHTRNTMEFF